VYHFRPGTDNQTSSEEIQQAVSVGRQVVSTRTRIPEIPQLEVEGMQKRVPRLTPRTTDPMLCPIWNISLLGQTAKEVGRSLPPTPPTPVHPTHYGTPRGPVRSDGTGSGTDNEGVPPTPRLRGRDSDREGTPCLD